MVWKGIRHLCISSVCLAPTAKAPPSIKLKFYDDLQDTIDRIPHNDILVMLGDFNARVGVLDTGNNLWQGVIGKHGLSERNLVGEECLEFCALNQLSIMNNWFHKKKSIKVLGRTQQQRNVTL